jgi:hypothetical protein
MAGLIVEISNRHGRQYHRIDGPVLRVGRAWDNDVIVPDPTVSPYHFLIRREPGGGFAIHSLADENGLQMGGSRVEGPIPIDRTPLDLDAGRTHVRVVETTQAVPPTRFISCHGNGPCLFGSWRWAGILFATFVVASLLENYLSTHEVLSWASFGRDQVIIISVALGLALGLLLINRLTAHRWDFAASLSMVSLLLLIATLVDHLKGFLGYYFTSPAPGYFIDVLWYLLVLPLALAWFLIRLNHGRPGPVSLVMAIILTPNAYIHSKELIRYTGWFDTFSKRAHYSQALSPWDLRRKQTISIDEFVNSLTANTRLKQSD